MEAPTSCSDCLRSSPSSLVTLIPLCRMLRKDKEEAEAIKHAKALEEEKAMYSVRAGPGGGRNVSQGGRTPHHPGTHPTPGPSLPAPAEGVPGEAPEGPKDQPTQVGRVLPWVPTLPVSVFPGSREGAGAQKTLWGQACGLWRALVGQ